jgi:thiamine-phosphate pyrophosphorylase
MIQNLAEILRLMLVTDDRLLEGRDVVEVCRAAERGGVTCAQLRLKEATPRELVVQVRRLKAALRIPVIVNDRLDVAIAGGADGVHLGPDDIPVAVARKAVPPGFLIGASVGTVAEVPNGEGAEYWGVGPYKATGTKSDAGKALGPEGLKRMIGLASQSKVCVAIGGVVPEDVSSILAAGAAGVAVVSGILGAADIERAARQYAVKLQQMSEG